MNKLLTGRILLLIGMAIGLISLWATIKHIGNPAYVLIETSPAKATHPWHHNFREVLGNIAAMTVFLLVFFGPERFRTRQTWALIVILMAGYYAGFWVGTPLLPELASDTWRSEAVHIGMSAFSIAGALVAKEAFFKSALSDVSAYGTSL